MKTTWDGHNYNLEFDNGRIIILTGDEIKEFNDWLIKNRDKIRRPEDEHLSKM